MKISLLIIISLSFLIGCTSTSKVSHNKTITGGNNTVEINNKNSEFLVTNHESKIIFNGQNNKIVFEYLNSYFNTDNNKDIIIIEGNGNTIRLSHKKVIDNTKKDIDTIVITTNESYIEIINKYLIDNNSDTTTKRYNVIDNFSFKDVSNMSYIQDSVTLENKITGKWMLAKDVFDFYLNLSLKGNDNAMFYLGQFYEMGIGIQKDLKKAEYFFKMASNKGNTDAQTSLAYLYENEIIEIPEGKFQAIELYKKAASKGNSYAIERLKELNK